VPIGMKDLFCTEGVQTTAASHILEGFVPQYESTVSAKALGGGRGDARQAQPRPVRDGLVQRDQRVRQCDLAVARRQAAKHRWLPAARRAVRSSAISARLCPAATGTDTGGSIRQPAAFTGISGIKPTYGRCSRWGIVAFASRLIRRADGAHREGLRDHAGSDGRLRREGFDQLDLPVPQWEAASPAICAARRSASRRNTAPMDGMPIQIAALWDQGIAWLKDAGAEVVEVSLPHTKYALPTYYIIAPAEASSNLARYDGVRYGQRDLPDGAGLQDMYAATRAAGFGDEVKRRIMIGTYVLSAGFYDAYYTQA
jgi:aspartyl-tRNA(Asn)/glutamyl-tRNA(Gln) amidotransferase subunit A